jgi:hypothetical protein
MRPDIGWQILPQAGMTSLVVPWDVGGLARVVGWLDPSSQQAANVWCLQHGVVHASLIMAFDWVDHFLAALGVGPFSVAASFVRAALDSVADDDLAGDVAAVTYNAMYYSLSPDVTCTPFAVCAQPTRPASFAGVYGAGPEWLPRSLSPGSGTGPSDVSEQSGSAVSADNARCATGRARQDTQVDVEHAAEALDAGGSVKREFASNGSLRSTSGELKKRHRRGCRGAKHQQSDC